MRLVILHSNRRCAIAKMTAVVEFGQRGLDGAVAIYL